MLHVGDASVSRYIDRKRKAKRAIMYIRIKYLLQSLSSRPRGCGAGRIPTKFRLLLELIIFGILVFASLFPF